MTNRQVSSRIIEANRLCIMRRPSLVRMRARRLAAVEREIRDCVHAHGWLERTRFHIEDDIPGQWDEARREAWKLAGKLIEELESEGDALLDEFESAHNAYVSIFRPKGNDKD